MTRGRIVLITNDAVYTTTEFNGDMYYDYYGKEVIEGLKSVESYDDYLDFADKFNSENFEYPKQIVYQIGELETDKDIERMKILFDMSNNYFENWDSDYLYIKNISTKNWDFVLRDEDWDITLKPGEICSLNFGRLAKDYDGNNRIEKHIKEDIVDDIESLGWTVREYDDFIEISRYSPAGEDLTETLDYKSPLYEQLDDLYKYFDPDQHAAEWYGQGRGEPNDLQTLLDDAKSIEEMYRELRNKLWKR